MLEGAPYNRTLGRIRLLAIYGLVVSLVVLARPTPLSVSVGFAWVALGESIRVWAAGHLQKNVQLTTSGPYRYTRNPLYLGRLLIFTGLCLMARLPFGSNYWVLGIGYLVFFAYYLPRKERVEGERLLRAHGEPYRRYATSVPALIPTLRPYPLDVSSGWSSIRLTDNREHWMLVGLTLLSGALLWVAHFSPSGLLTVWLDRW